MRTFAQQQKPSQEATSTFAAKPNRPLSEQSHDVSDILCLQRTIENQAVQQQLLQAEPDDLEARSINNEATRFEHDFSQIPVHPKSPAGMQANLPVSPGGDIYEEEADGVSEQERLQTKLVQDSDRGQIAAPTIVNEVIAAPGHALDTATRAFMETRFGYDFSQVRVHTDERAAESARALKARAYTVGRHVVIGSGQPSPETVGGRHLLAHELTHVVQADTAASHPARLSSPVHALESEARRVAAAIHSGNAAPPIHGMAQAPFVPLREGTDELGAPTFGNLPLDKSRYSGPRVVELVNEGGKWKEVASGRIAEVRTAKGSYDFVIKDNRIWAVRSSSKNLGHTEAAQGGRVTWAGIVSFTQSGALKTWTNASGHYLPSGSFAENAARLLQDVPIAHKDSKFVQTHKGPVTRPVTNRRQGPQLPVFQPQTKPPAKTPAVSNTTGSKPGKDTGMTTGKDVLPAVSPQPQATPKPQVTTTTTTGGRNQKELAKAIAQSASGVANAIRFTQRLRVYIATWGALQSALGMLALIDNMTKLLAHGTTMPDEQRKADQMLRQSQEAVTEAEEATADISLFGWTALTGEALRNEDAEALSAIDDTLTKLRRSLEESAKQLQDLSNDLFRSAHSLRNEQLKQLVQIMMPHLSGTVNNAIAFSVHESLERLHGTIHASATSFATASQTLSYWAHQVKALEDSANDAWWDVARKRAQEQLQLQNSLKAAEQFRSEAPVVETEHERQSREFLNKLQDPNTLNRAR